MKDKGIILLHYEEKHRKMNYVVRYGKVCVITSKQSNKVNYIKKHQSAVIEFENGEMHTVIPTIIQKEEHVKDLFNYMTDLENNHFKMYQDEFLAIEFNL
ncbi:MAG: hypothetical protein EP317_05485 [Bacillota bacterium]|nr:MAG: hypothetical protein EP317_05485 [Bacillota bacterium]